MAWAYHLVRTPPYFASKADIWRYAVMYTYGGMYLDDDSDIRTPLDEVNRAQLLTPAVLQRHLNATNFLVTFAGCYCG